MKIKTAVMLQDQDQDYQIVSLSPGLLITRLEYEIFCSSIILCIIINIWKPILHQF